MIPTRPGGNSASDGPGAHKSRRMQTEKDGKSKEASAGDTMESYSRCDVLPFSPPSPAHGHCEPEVVSRKKLSKLRLHGSLPPAAMAVGCNVW